MRSIALVILALILAGCGKGPSSSATQASKSADTQPEKKTTRSIKDKLQNDETINFADDDPVMNAAIQKAKNTVRAQFIPALQKPKPGQTGFAIKYPVKDGKQFEHFWISGVSYDGNRFTGQLDNDPQLVKNVKLGQRMVVRPEEISDWMYADQGRLMGGYTIRVIRDQLKGKERQEFDQAFPFKID